MPSGQIVRSGPMGWKKCAAPTTVKHVSFGCVRIAEFAVTIDDSKLPHDGLAPLGLGELLQTLEYTNFEAYETSRSTSRRGVHHLDDFERRGLLLGRLDETPDPEAVLALEACEEANRKIRGQTVTTYERDTDYEEETTASGWSSRLRPDDSDGAARTRNKPSYTTAEEGASRDGLGGGFRERDEEEESRRKARALSEKAATDSRKAERRRCAGCKRYACIC